MLQALYDEDIVEEDLIVAWYNKPSAGKVLGVDASAATARARGRQALCGVAGGGRVG